MRLPLLLLLLAAAACDSAPTGPTEAALTVRIGGELRGEGTPAPLPAPLVRADLARLPGVPTGALYVAVSRSYQGQAGAPIGFPDPVVLLEERRDGSLQPVAAGSLPADPDRVGLFAVAPAAFFEGRAAPRVNVVSQPSRLDSLVLRAGAGLLGPDKAAALSLGALPLTARLGAVVRGVDRAAPSLMPVLVARYRPETGCDLGATVTPLLRNPRREPLYATPADTTALGRCRPPSTETGAVEAALVLLPR